MFCFTFASAVFTIADSEQKSMNRVGDIAVWVMSSDSATALARKHSVYISTEFTRTNKHRHVSAEAVMWATWGLIVCSFFLLSPFENCRWLNALLQNHSLNCNCLPFKACPVKSITTGCWLCSIDWDYRDKNLMPSDTFLGLKPPSWSSSTSTPVVSSVSYSVKLLELFHRTLKDTATVGQLPWILLWPCCFSSLWHATVSLHSADTSTGFGGFSIGERFGSLSAGRLIAERPQKCCETRDSGFRKPVKDCWFTP